MSDRFHSLTFRPGYRHLALCRDGRRRSAVVTGWPDYCSAPAAVQVTAGGRRSTVSGFLIFGSAHLLEFVGTGRNAGLIPWTGHRPRVATLARKVISSTAWGFACPGVHWGLPSEHVAQLAAGFRYRIATGCPPAWTAGNALAHEVYRKLTLADLGNLERFFSKLERFDRSAGE